MKNKKYPETTIVYTDGPTITCKHEKLDLNLDTFILNLNTIKVGQDDKQETFDLVKLFRNIDSLSKNKFEIFLEVLKECGIKTGYDFMHFMSVIQEHCIDKNITGYEEVKKIWNSHKESITNIKDSCEKDKTYLGKLYADKETYEWLTTPSNEDDDVGYWQPDQVTELDDKTYDAFEKEVMNPKLDVERIEKCKDIFEGIDKVEVKKE